MKILKAERNKRRIHSKWEGALENRKRETTVFQANTDFKKNIFNRLEFLYNRPIDLRKWGRKDEET